MAATETSPLLPTTIDNDATTIPPTKVSILVELIGARQLPVNNMDTYCVIQYGSRTIHRTKPFAPKVSKAARFTQALRLFGGAGEQVMTRKLQNPIWTIQEDSLFAFQATKNDIDNNKPLTITIWAAPRHLNLKNRAAMAMVAKKNYDQLQFVGKVQINTPSLLENCTEERQEMELVDDLGRTIVDSRGETSMLAYRCRIASKADLEFVDGWNSTPQVKKWERADIVQSPLSPRATLVTELPEQQVQGATMATAVTSNITPVLQRKGTVHIKPYPDPVRVASTQYMTATMLKTQTQLPSQKWIEAGSEGSSLGRIYLEILSAHGLPNVDIGGTVGNETDAFCAAVYGDAMVQTDIIDDELSPHWPCWSQRAFILHMQHPSQVLYLSLFGFKRLPLQHRPIGRVEVNPVNLQHNTLYNFEYDLCGLSHAAERKSQGKLRFRIRIEVDDERKFLLAALRPQPAVYINVRQKKSLTVARYTACGEYDNEEKFSLGVLQGYIDEIVEGYIRRIVYSLQDGIPSLVFWRDQVSFRSIGFPLYSLIAFIMGILVVEHPALFPACLCFGLAMFFLAQMQHRLKSPSPWRRCFSFSHFLRILVLGESVPAYQSINPNAGVEETKAEEEALKKRIKSDKEFGLKKETVEKEIEEVENAKVQTSKVIPVELLVVLGKVQSIVGGKLKLRTVWDAQKDLSTQPYSKDICRLMRSIDSIVTWEESDLAFWITLVLLIAGCVSLLLPWGFLFRWAGRIVVVLLVGPQNKLVDILWYQNQPSDEQRIYQLFAKRMFEARFKQEEASKLKAFRHILFGKYSTWVPTVFWTPHQDFPLPSSTAYVGANKAPAVSKRKSQNTPVVVGQQLHGCMVFRPEDAWIRNSEESRLGKGNADALVAAEQDQGEDVLDTSRKEQTNKREPSMILNEGFEITDMFDEEAGFVDNVLKPVREESINELGVEVMGTQDDDIKFQPAWKSTAEIPEVVEEEDEESEESLDEEEGAPVDDSGLTPTVPVRISTRDRVDYQSTIELGFDVAEQLEEEKYFADQQPGVLATSTPSKEASDMHTSATKDNSFVDTGGSTPVVPVRISERDRVDQQSMIELGVEIGEQIENGRDIAQRAQDGGFAPSTTFRNDTPSTTSQRNARGAKRTFMIREEAWAYDSTDEENFAAERLYPTDECESDEEAIEIDHSTTVVDASCAELGFEVMEA